MDLEMMDEGMKQVVREVADCLRKHGEENMAGIVETLGEYFSVMDETISDQLKMTSGYEEEMEKLKEEISAKEALISARNDILSYQKELVTLYKTHLSCLTELCVKKDKCLCNDSKAAESGMEGG